MRKKVWLWGLGLAGLVVALVVVLVVVLSPKGERSLGVFEIGSVKITLDKEIVTKSVCKEMSARVVLGVVIGDGEDLSGYDIPTIEWSFVGDDFGCEVDDGALLLGDVLGRVVLQVCVRSQNVVASQVEIEIVPTEGAVLQSLAIVGSPQTHFVEGAIFAFEGGQVVAQFDKGSAVVTALVEWEQEVLLAIHTEVLLSYTHKQVTKWVQMPISVQPRTLQEIMIVRPPERVEYVEGQYFDTTGMIVVARYEYGQQEITGAVEYAREQSLVYGDLFVELRYTENGVTKTAKQAVEVADKNLQEIVVDTRDVKRQYVQGEPFDKQGLCVVALFEFVEMGVEDYVLSTEGMLMASDKEIVVSYAYGGVFKYASIEIEVYPPYQLTRFVQLENPTFAALTWLYSYTMDGVSLVVDYTAWQDNGLVYEVDNGLYQVPVGAVVTLYALSGAIIDFVIDGQGQNMQYPNKSIEWVVPYGQNASTDTQNSREVANDFSKQETVQISYLLQSGNFVSLFFEGVTPLVLSYKLTGEFVSLKESDLALLAFFYEGNGVYRCTYQVDGVSLSLVQLSRYKFDSDQKILVVKQDPMARRGEYASN